MGEGKVLKTRSLAAWLREKLRIGLGIYWRISRAEIRHRQSKRLPSGALSIDIGAYQGDGVSWLRETFQAHVIAIEPVPAFAKTLRERFYQDPHVTVIEASLTRKAGTETLFLAGDATTGFSSSDRDTVTVVSLSAPEFFAQHKTDFVTINAEGAEFDILESLMEREMLGQMPRIEIQFHHFVTGAIQRRRKIRKALRRTHSCRYNTPFVWEYWTHKSLANVD